MLSNLAIASTESIVDESYSGMFEPETVLPSQFYGDDVIGIAGGERKLMAAVLADGVENYLDSFCGEMGRTARAEAREWVETRDPGYIFSFDCVCQSLGINPEYLRLGLSRYVFAAHTASRQWKKIRRPRK